MKIENGAESPSFRAPTVCRTVRTMTHTLLPAALLWVSACSQGQDMNTTTDTPTEESEPIRKLNPAPKRGYVITMTLKDAPGPFASIEAVAQYTVENSAECGKKVPIAGAFPRISTSEPFKLARVSESEFRGTVYADLVLDEDYFGRGVCHWEFSSVSVHLSATEDEKDTSFIPSIDSEVVTSLGLEARYYWKKNYPRVDGYDNFPEFGESSLDGVPEDKRGEFFIISLASAEVSP